MDDKLNILIIPSWYSSINSSTRGSFFKEHAEALARRGHHVTILYTEVYGIKRLDEYFKNKKIKNYISNNLKVYRSTRMKLPKGDKINIFNMEIQRLFKKFVMNNNKIDIIHAHSYMAGFTALNLKEKYGIPFVITEHFTGFARKIIPKKHEKYISKQFKSADKIIAVSQGLKEDLSLYIAPEKIDVIPNMVDIKKFSINNNEAIDKKFRFLSVSYLMYKKGIDILIKAFYKNFKGNDKVELFIGGDGEEKENLHKLVNDLGLAGQVKFLNALDRDQVIKNMQKCDVFVLPSRFETFGVVFIEALACGKPIIATSTGGPDTIVNEKNGILVKVEDIDGLAKGMKDIRDEYCKYNSFEIREDCIKRFSEESIIGTLEKIYNDILS